MMASVWGRKKKTTWKCFFLLWLSLLASSRPVSATGEEERACSNIDIRNTVDQFSKLENCTVVEGYLRIVLIENAKSQDFANLSFPKLTEITGHLLLYRVSGLLSLANLFPRLAVIRGNKLFHNFAIVVYEMFHIQEIGLGSLTDILRGSLFITKNPNLCYLETIDWSRILRAEVEHNVIRHNKNPDTCPNTCPSHCPKDVLCWQGSTSGDINCRLCWNSKTCQKVCHNNCSRNNASCFNDDPTRCCNKECLGGCFGTGGAHQCNACLHVVYENRCSQRCPFGTYEFMDRRCLIEQECRNLSLSGGRNDNSLDGLGDGSDNFREVSRRAYWKPFMKNNNGKCVEECPSDYTEDPKDRHVCIPCTEKCPKVCAGIMIDNVGDAETLRGCTIIDGSLQIQINGGANIIQELEKNLETIVEIKHYLKISRSFPLISLNFLKNLEVIRGVRLDRNEYAVSVSDNQNLQHLWDLKSRGRNFTIEKGKLFFHFNPKLCYQEIEKFYHKVYKVNKTLDPAEVSPLSNGDKIACDVATINLEINQIGPNNAVFAWDNFLNSMPDKRSLLGYVLHIKEAPFKNVSILDGRDACGTDVWRIIDTVSTSSSLGQPGTSLDNPGRGNSRQPRFPQIVQLVPSLKPFTQYAVFVRTYTVDTENRGARSTIVYFTTASDTPSPPTEVKAFVKEPDKIMVAWKPPKTPRGEVAYYIITGIELKDSQEYLNQRDFCIDSRHPSTFKKQFEFEEPKPTSISTKATSKSDQTPSKDCCACTVTNPLLEKEEALTNMVNRVEDFLHNNIYIKNPNAHAYQLDDMGTVIDANTNNRTQTTRSIPNNLTYAQLVRTTSTTASYSTEETRFSNTSPSVSTTMETTTEAANSSDDNASQLRKFTKIVMVEEMDNERRQGVKEIVDLYHFTRYSISIRACQNRSKVPEITAHDPCSTETIVYTRTLPLAGADTILDSSVVAKRENASDGSIFVKWDEPLTPNGLIVTYHLEYTSVEDKSNVHVQCVSQLKYSEMRGAVLKADAGKYKLRVRATSLYGEGNWTSPIDFEILKAEEGSKTELIIGMVVLSLILLFVSLLFGYYIYKKKKKRSIADGILYASVNPEYMSAGLVYEADEWEVPREKITKIRELGQGSFGMVYEGRAIDMIPGQPDLLCAIKTVNESASLREQIEFLQEASVMKAFNCHHVVKLLGVVSKGSPTLVIMELMANGDLKSYLRSHRPDEAENVGRPPPTLKQIFQMAIEIADGMAYLAAKKFVHRDLAARNCMVDANLTVKIGDFGMTRDIYETDYYRKGGKGLLPVRWMAPESLKDGVFTNQSDVWSYGVVLWEMATLSSQPYQGLSNEQVLKYVISGNIMEMPENCPRKLYTMMKLCWEKNPKARPTFMEMIEFVLTDIDHDEFKKKSFYHEFKAQAGSPDNQEEDDVEAATPVTPLKSSLPSATSARCRNAAAILSRNSRESLCADRENATRFFSSLQNPLRRVSSNSTSSGGGAGDERGGALTGGTDAVRNGGGGVCLNCGIRTCDGACETALPMSSANAMLLEEGNGPAIRIMATNNGASDGSKGSKVSNLSNGSLQNGHAHFASGRTTTC